MPATVRYLPSYSYGPNVCDIAWPELNGVYPTVAFFHGGAWTDIYGDKTVYSENSLIFDDQHINQIKRIASRFFVAATFNFSNFYPQSIQDIQAAIVWLKTLGCVNNDRIILVGESSGGHLVTKVGWADPTIHAVVSNCGIYNLRSAEHSFITTSLQNTLGAAKGNEIWTEASSVYGTSSPQSLVVENTPDTLMPPVSQMVIQNPNIEYHALPGPDHCSGLDRAAWWTLLDDYLERIT